MKRGTVISLEEYRKKKARQKQDVPPVARGKGLPDARELWELLDRNLSVQLWEKMVQ